MDKQTKQMDKTTPQLIMIELDIFPDFSGISSIQGIRNELDRLEAEGATHVDISAKDDYGYPRICAIAYCQRLETAAEVQARLHEEAQREAYKKAFELRQLEDLKKKYESM
jgi:hypothetical protein